MGMLTTKFEKVQLLKGKADGISRYYPGEICPHKIGAETFLAIQTPEGQRSYAAVKVKSIRPETLDKRKMDDRLAKLDGFPNAREWFKHFQTLYKGPEKGKVFRLQLIITDIED